MRRTRARLCSGSFEVIEPKGAMIKYLPEIIAECGAVYVGYEEATLICSEFERLKNELSGCDSRMYPHCSPS